MPDTVNLPFSPEDLKSRGTVQDPLHRLLRLRAGAAVKRYHTFPTLGNQLVGGHSHNVLMILMALNPDASRELILATQYHDLAEYDTGDCPANVKWKFPVIAEMLEKAEEEINAKLAIRTVLTEEDKEWLRTCDTLEYCLYAYEQRLLGNLNMNVVFNRGIKRLADYPIVKKEHSVLKLILALRMNYMSLGGDLELPEPLSL